MRRIGSPLPMVLLVLMTMWIQPALNAADFPPRILDDLCSESFRTRNEAEAELLAWARQRPGRSMEQILRESRRNPEPEVRERCLSVLRELVNDEYLRGGEGYVGIFMNDEVMMVPGDAEVRRVIRILRVMPDSAASDAGLVAGDIIVGAAGRKWVDGRASQHFTEQIRGLKPLAKVKLAILRDEALEDVEVTLGRRPLIPEDVFQMGDPDATEAAARKAREDYFKEWLQRQPEHP